VAVVDKTVPYELLFLFGEDGLLKVGQYIDRRIVEIDGERVSDQPGTAKPIGSSPEEVQALLPGVALAAFAEIDRLNHIQRTHEKTVQSLNDQLTDTNEQNQVLALKVEELTKQVDDLLDLLNKASVPE
jgi:hypothetical protein